MATADMESLSYSARVRQAVEIGRRSRTDADAAKLLREWRAGGFTQRLLAAYACHGSRDSATLAELAADRSRTISGVAVSVLSAVGDDDALLLVLKTLPPRRAAKTLFRLGRSRTGVVDRFLLDRAGAGDSIAWPLMPLGSTSVFEPYLKEAFERGGDLFWRRFAVFHHARAATEIASRLDAATTPDGLLFRFARTVIAVLSDRLPEVAYPVVLALKRHVPLASIPLQMLAARRPELIAELILSSKESVAVSFERTAHRLGIARIVALYRRSSQYLGNQDRWLARLPSSDREAIYRELVPAWTTAEGIVPMSIVRRMPASLRKAESRRIVALPELAARPLQRLPYVGLLDWADALESTKTWLGHPEADNRAAALVALCEAARFDWTRLGDLLELLGARKYEQDPVRSAFLNALALLPPGRWRSELLSALARIIRDALDAADLSATSVAALSRLVFAVLPFHPVWAVEQITEFTRERGFSGWMSRPLTAEDVRRIAPALTSVIRTWLDRENEGRLVALAATVGRRLPEWPELVEALERLVQKAAYQHTAASAMALLVKHLPTQRERVITAVLARDESWVLQPPVMNFLHARRQDLLTPFLGQRTYSGRFSTGNVRHVLPLASGFHRWTDSQQETFAGTLAKLSQPPPKLKDTQVTWDVLFAVRRLSELPATGPDRLITLANDGRPAVQETAVRALGRLDGRQGVTALLEALGDSRARFAVYALRSALSDLHPQQVLTVMRGIPMGKVTVAKEAVRLAGEFGGVESLAWFVELDRQDLHRDVRGAMLRALWDHLEEEEAWSILDASVSSPDPGVVIGLARIQIDRASVAARERVANLLRRLLDHPEPSVRVAVLNRLTAQPVPDVKRLLLSAILQKFASAVPDERSGGLRAALAAASDADADAFVSAVRSLFSRKRELSAVLTDFAGLTRPLGPRLVEVRSAVLAAIELDPSLALLQIRLAVARLAAEHFANWTHKLVGSGRWHAGTQTAVLEALVESAQPVEDLERGESVWAASPDPASHWLALRVLIHTASIQGWSEPRRDRLRGYQRDPSSMIADEAVLTFPPVINATE